MNARFSLRMLLVAWIVLTASTYPAISAAELLANTPSYRVIYSFPSGPTAGKHPVAPVTVVGGMLYGTTTGGGLFDRGTAFGLTPSGNETVLYNFGAGTHDGVAPDSVLTLFDGELFGTTKFSAGKAQGGTLFKIGPNGVETVLKNFLVQSYDGVQPTGGLIAVDGALYGTTSLGGRYGGGNIYGIAPNGAEKVIYAFRGPPDASEPLTRLVYLNGHLYGCSFTGGVYEDAAGAIFSVDRDGTESVVHSFFGGKDGSRPIALVAMDGVLYGTNFTGGLYSSGTVFRFTPAGKLTTLYSFGMPGTASGRPGVSHGLVAHSGKLYGTTLATSSGGPTIFSITPAGVVTTIHIFPPSENFVDGGLTAAGCVIYGASTYGGKYGNGFIFAITP